jgi:putative endonuclease
MAYVYVLRSLKDKNKYIGSTIDLDKRLEKHNKGYVLSTKNRRPLELIAYQYFDKIEDAALFEKKYKRSNDLLERRIKSGEVKTVQRGAAQRALPGGV